MLLKKRSEEALNGHVLNRAAHVFIRKRKVYSDIITGVSVLHLVKLTVLIHTLDIQCNAACPCGKVSDNLRSLEKHITVCEISGPNHNFPTEQVHQLIGLKYELLKKSARQLETRLRALHSENSKELRSRKRKRHGSTVSSPGKQTPLDG